MASSFTLELDTTGPQGVAAVISGGAVYTAVRDVSVAVTSTSGDVVQVKIWGDVDPAANPNIQPLEANSAWIMLASPHAVRLAAGDGNKQVNVRLMDDVGNQSVVASDVITLDATLPVVNVTAGPDVAKISEVAGHDTSSFSWQSDSDYAAFEVRVVPNVNSPRGSGAVIPAAGGSTNVAGGASVANTVVNTMIHGADLAAASAGDGQKIVKVFVQDAAGNWSA